MKKIVSVVLAIAMIMAVCTVNAFALKDTKDLGVQVYAQPHSDWSWHSTAFTNVQLGDTVTIVADDIFAFDGIDCTAGVNFGLQIGDSTLENGGETSNIKYSVSDIVIVADGYADYVIPAQKRDADLCAAEESWGLSGNSDNVMFDLAAACGSSEAADWTAYMDAITSITFTITYDAYNDVMADGSAYAADAAPAEEPAAEEAPAVEPVEEAPVEAAPVETAPATTAPAPAKTGVVMAILPMAVAAAAVAFSKKR